MVTNRTSPFSEGGEVYGIVVIGESNSGKTALAQSLMAAASGEYPEVEESIHPWHGGSFCVPASSKMDHDAVEAKLAAIEGGSANLQRRGADIPCPRANEPVAIPPRRKGGSFVRTRINGRNSFRITHA